MKPAGLEAERVFLRLRAYCCSGLNGNLVFRLSIKPTCGLTAATVRRAEFFSTKTPSRQTFIGPVSCPVFPLIALFGFAEQLLSRWTQTSSENAFSGMLGAMFVGMTWGMMLSVALYRSFFVWRRSR